MKIQEIVVETAATLKPLTPEQQRIKSLKQNAERSREQLQRERERQRQQRETERKRKLQKQGLT